MDGYFENRKRSREDDYSSDSTPLSKRINNLHINYEDLHLNDSSSSSNCSVSLPPLMNMESKVPKSESAKGLVPASTTPSEENTGNYQYSPELSQEQNPFYYAKNKLLYNLHVERLKRGSV